MNSVIHYTYTENTLVKERSGYGIRSAQNCTISSGERMLISTGIRIDMPRGFHGKIEGRMDLIKRGIDIFSNIVDSPSYTITVLLINNSPEPFHLKNGDYIASVIIQQHWWGCFAPS